MNSSHTKKSLQWFRDNRPDHFSFITKVILPKARKNIIITAGVKVGKKDLVIIQALSAKSPDETHIFVSNFVRNDCAEQREELEAYGITCFFGNEIAKLDSFLRFGKFYVIHLDESDYGTGLNQQFNTILDLVDKPNVVFRFYSATNEEAIYSNFGKSCYVARMRNPKNFVGPDEFVCRGWVKPSSPFWNFEKSRPSKQAKDAVYRWLSSSKPYAVLRLTEKTSDDKTHFSILDKCPAFRQWAEYHGITLKFIDGDENFYWGKRPEGKENSWAALDRSSRTLLVINQTCIRSTEVGFHPLIEFWHDHRKKSTSYNTCAQALFRVVHYPYSPSKYWENPAVKIRVYGCLPTFLYAGGRIDAPTYERLSGRRIIERKPFQSIFSRHYSNRPWYFRFWKWCTKIFGNRA